MASFHVLGNLGLASGKGIIHTSLGLLLASFTSAFGVKSNMEVEALALEAGTGYALFSVPIFGNSEENSIVCRSENTVAKLMTMINFDDFSKMYIKQLLLEEGNCDQETNLHLGYIQTLNQGQDMEGCLNDPPG
ncbi:hypothetical protein ACH5RR_040904 [Cinchona calisaya]|uniref:Uncharacterized protein n=1 Tax=Cinchona calisaya TaxID=153742 RepID=A0ABD2XV24_9GENT